MNGFGFTTLIVALWLSPVLVIVGMVWIARRFGVDLRR